ncbi:uncharacterized protein LOC62_05G007558 [Vanrija pseudolonga]|uniref:Uncharacterized protein n=1 Tax=Vanrija pseudolonga TaxID=143232 RepID=A0AAF0YFQ4_9TREE|nr:hypothetical protein LOC62_05G007558 [Vanrija pseudolonga]
MPPHPDYQPPRLRIPPKEFRTAAVVRVALGQVIFQSTWVAMLLSYLASKESRVPMREAKQVYLDRKLKRLFLWTRILHRTLRP